MYTMFASDSGAAGGCSSGIYSNLACHDSGGYVEACVVRIRFLRGRPAPRDTGAERDAEPSVEAPLLTPSLTSKRSSCLHTFVTTAFWRLA